jgi:hypothetical protein
MTSEDLPKDEKTIQTLEEICENTRAIRRVVNRIFDHLQESEDKDNNYDTDSMTWEDLYNSDNMYS